MTPAFSSRLIGLCGLCIGIFIGLSLPALVPIVRPTVVAPPSENGRLEALLVRVSALAEAIESLREQVASIDVTRMAVAGDAALGAKGEAAGAAVASANVSAMPTEEKEANWITVLDKGIAGVLVEHGLTPFDPGVAPRILSASQALRIADDEFEAALRQPLEERKARAVSADEFAELQSPFLAERNRKRRAALDLLRNEMDSLGR
jgi:hypothetical protein